MWCSDTLCCFQCWLQYVSSQDAGKLLTWQMDVAIATKNINAATGQWYIFEPVTVINTIIFIY